MRGRHYVCVVRYETEDGRTLEVTSKKMTQRAAWRLAHRYNVGYVRTGWSSWCPELVRTDCPAHVCFVGSKEAGYTVKEVANDG